MTESPNIRTLIAANDPLAQIALTSYLAQADDITVIATAEDGAEAVAEAQHRQTDVVLMDLRMPKLDGLEAAQHILTHGKGTRILILAPIDSSDAVTLALQTRVHGFLLKTAAPESVVEAVRAVHRGMTVFSAETIWRLGGDFTYPERAHPRFSGREEQVLSLICKACSNAEIARRLYLSESRVKALVSSIMTKLEVDSRLKVAVRAREWQLVRQG